MAGAVMTGNRAVRSTPGRGVRRGVPAAAAEKLAPLKAAIRRRWPSARPRDRQRQTPVSGGGAPAAPTAAADKL